MTATKKADTKMQKDLRMSEISCNFALAFEKSRENAEKLTRLKKKLTKNLVKSKISRNFATDFGLKLRKQAEH